jgi:hypothetical protein
MLYSIIALVVYLLLCLAFRINFETSVIYWLFAICVAIPKGVSETVINNYQYIKET